MIASIRAIEDEFGIYHRGDIFASAARPGINRGGLPVFLIAR
jgi:hypothetical protein